MIACSLFLTKKALSLWYFYGEKRSFKHVLFLCLVAKGWDKFYAQNLFVAMSYPSWFILWIFVYWLTFVPDKHLFLNDVLMVQQGANGNEITVCHKCWCWLWFKLKGRLLLSFMLGQCYQIEVGSLVDDSKQHRKLQQTTNYQMV